MKQSSSRNCALDYMRVLGLFLVILAHCGVKGILFEARNFDVTMLVFVSSFVFALGYHGNWRGYFLKRVRRILFPVWTFLIIYFGSLMSAGSQLSINDIVRSFLMVDGIGYVWIFRILLTMALINPFIYRITEKMNPYLVLIVIIGLMFGNHYFQVWMPNINSFAGRLFNFVMAYTVGYGVVSAVGMMWSKLKYEEKIIYFLTFLGIFMAYGITRSWPSIQEYKYPPKGYYSCYGLTWSVVLYEILTLVKIKGNGFINWVGSHSLYIYLAHIAILRFVHFTPWYLTYVCVLAGSILLAYVFCFVKEQVRR